MPYNKRSTILALLTAAALSGCSTPKHTDLLVFGTNTQFGVALTSDATSTPGVNIGYKRYELVLMPLYVNAKESRFAPSTPTSPTDTDKLKYVGSEATTPAATDTYSVLASFGARGSANTSGTAEVGIAQYFATGLAARTLAYAGGALINTGDKASENAPETAKAAAAAAGAESPVVIALKASANRFTAEGQIMDEFSKLDDIRKNSFLAKLNQGINRTNGSNAVTAANMQQQLSSMNDAEIAYAALLIKNP